MIKNLIALLAGFIFGFGLCILQMVGLREIMGFLDVASGNWDPSLLLVMSSALIVVSIGYRLALKAGKSLLDQKFHLPTNMEIDSKLVLRQYNVDGVLVIGAILFGIGSELLILKIKV